MAGKDSLIGMLRRFDECSSPGGHPDIEARLARLVVGRNLDAPTWDIQQSLIALVLMEMLEQGLKDDARPILQHVVHQIQARFEESSSWREKAAPYLQLVEQRASTIVSLDRLDFTGPSSTELWEDHSRFRRQLAASIQEREKCPMFEDPEKYLRQLLNRSRTTDGEYAPAAGPLFRRLADMRMRQGRFEEAEATYRKALMRIPRAPKPWPAELRQVLESLATCLEKTGVKRAEAASLKRLAQEIVAGPPPPAPRPVGPGVRSTRRRGAILTRGPVRRLELPDPGRPGATGTSLPRRG